MNEPFKSGDTLAAPTDNQGLTIMGSWVIGHNFAGYLPEADTYAYESWDDAAEALASLMKEYADTDDEMAAENLPEDAFDDDQPSMRATVDAILTDDGPAIRGINWFDVVEDNSGRRIEFWLTWDTDREADDDEL